VIHWVKSIAIQKEDVGNYPNIKGDIAVGHYKPIGGNRFLNDCHEYIFHFTKSGEVSLDRLAIGVPYQDKSNIRRWKSVKEDKRCRGNTWFIPYQTIWDSQKQRPHPSTFPIRLPEMCIRLHGLNKAKLVVDPFIGIGSTAISCLRLGKTCIGFEIDETYLKIASGWIRSYRIQPVLPTRTDVEAGTLILSELVLQTGPDNCEHTIPLLHAVRLKLAEGLGGRELLREVRKFRPDAKESTVYAMSSKILSGKLPS